MASHLYANRSRFVRFTPHAALLFGFIGLEKPHRSNPVKEKLLLLPFYM